MRAPRIPGIPEAEALVASRVEAQAQAEDESFSQGLTPEELERDAARREHGRNQRFRSNFENLAIVAMWILAIFVLAVGAVWLWHLVAPSSRRWLSVEDVSHLQSVVTAGLLVGVVGNHFKKRLG